MSVDCVVSYAIGSVPSSSAPVTVYTQQITVQNMNCIQDFKTSLASVQDK